MHIVTTRCNQIKLTSTFYHLLIAVVTYGFIFKDSEQLTGIFCDNNEALEGFQLTEPNKHHLQLKKKKICS